MIDTRDYQEVHDFLGDNEEILIKDFDDPEGYYNVLLSDHLSYRFEVLKILGKGSFA